MKRCRKCLEIKSLELFPKHKDGADGHLNTCKDCKSSYMKTARKNCPSNSIEYKKSKRVDNTNKWLELGITEIQCKVCNEKKHPTLFYAKADTKYGLGYECTTCSKESNSSRYNRNVERNRKNALDYRRKNIDKVLAYSKTYKVPRHIKNAKNAEREALKIKATPPWLTIEQKAEILELYKLAKELQWLNNGEKLHVDHIVPLKSKKVCGLHVPWNLQIIPASWNIKKNNKFDLIRIDPNLKKEGI